MNVRSLLGDTLLTLGAYALAIPAALLPRRWWPRLHTWVPAEAAVIPSAIVVFLLAAWFGIPAYFRYIEETGSLLLKSGVPRPLMFFTFLTTPAGALSAYGCLTAQLREWAAVLGDKHGDPVVTLVDYAWHRRATRLRVAAAMRQRTDLEGPAVADRVVAGAQVGLAGAAWVIVASRRKEGWTKGTFVDTGDRWYRLGEPVQRDTPNGLRTLYPLYEPAELEVIRRGVRYDLPPVKNLESRI